MGKTLVILESPGKVKKIQEFLGPDYVVTASFGHIRDLDKGNDAIDKKNDFALKYIISEDKKEVVKKLKELYKKCDDVIMMQDADREGSGIAFHVCEVLGIKPETVKRATTVEITKNAVQKAVKNPGKLDMNLVHAYTARRVLDRLVGFDLSPLLWNKIQNGLSAGRVQSVAVRIIVEREKENKAFEAGSDFKIIGIFEVKDKKNKIHTFKAVLNKKYKDKDQAKKFLESTIGKEFFVKNIETKPGKKSAPAPFTTSTLQQEASRKFGFAVDRTMQVAQKLYEGGHITYMRTDSLNMSEDAINAAKEVISADFGKQYSNPKKFQTKSDTAQEAHEAIRPTHLEAPTISSTSDEQKLYELIWKRAVASQMSEAVFDRTIATIVSKDLKEEFVAKGEVLKFDGFLKLYMENSDEVESDDEDDNKSLPEMEKNQITPVLEIKGIEVYAKPSARYTEASLVKKMEELGIGRPSTYASVISTIQKRGYIEEKNLPAKKRDITNLTLKGKIIDEEVRTENFGAEKNKLFPTDIGTVVTDYLSSTFPDIMDYKFTANVENEFDEVANGKNEWKTMIKSFYGPFSEKLKGAKGNTERPGGREIGIDPTSKKPVIARIARFGPVIQLGTEKGDIRFAKLPEDKSIDSITLQEALDLLKWPRQLGEYNKLQVEVAIGKIGPYVKHDGKFASMTIPPEQITLEEAVEILIQKAEGGGGGGAIQDFGNIKVLKGQYGPYIKDVKKKKNYKIPVHLTAETITEDECLEVIGEAKTAPKKKAWGGKKKK